MASSARPRLPRACTRCSARKVSCDKKRPSCTRCTQTGLSCHYVTRARSQGFDSMVIQLNEARQAPGPGSMPRRLSSLGHMLSESAGASVGVPSDDDPESDAANDPGHLHLGAQTKSRYYAASHFALMGREIGDINSFLRQRSAYTHIQSSPAMQPSSSSSTSTTSASAKARDHLSTRPARLFGDIFQSPPHNASGQLVEPLPENMTLTDVAERLPALETCELLTNAYFKGYHSIKPLFDRTAFLERISQLDSWRTGNKAYYVPGSHFLAIYTSVLFAGCVVSPRSTLSGYFGSQTRETLSAHFQEYAIHSIRLADFTRSPSLWTFAAFLIVNSTWLREEQPLECCSFIGLAFRIAQMLGLHREPAKLLGVKPADIQIRRHLWWTLVALDTQIAIASGLPPMIDCKAFIVKKPEWHDEAEAVPSQPLDRASYNNKIPQVFVGGRYAFYDHMSGILRLVNSHTLCTTDVDTLLGFVRVIREEMNIYKDKLSQALQYQQWPSGQPFIGTGSSAESRSSPELASFATMVLSMLAAKPYAIVYGPVRQQSLLPYLRSRDPELFLHHFLQLAQDETFQPWHWCWPGQHQPLHSILALITELEDHPEDPSAGETRKLVDLGLLMCDASEQDGITSHEGGCVDIRPLNAGGGEAWSLIRRARNEVWEKTGLDANTLYCPRRAEDIVILNTSGRSSGQDLDFDFPISTGFQFENDSTYWPMLGGGAGSVWTDSFATGHGEPQSSTHDMA